MAKQIFANRVDGDGRDKIIILFTDGVPTVSLNADREHGASQNAGEREEFYSGMSGAEDAVNLANDLKSQYGVQIYTIGTSGLVADVPVETNNDNMGAVIASVSGEVFLSYVSSDYEGVSCVHTVTTEDGNNAVLTSSKLVFSQTIDGNTVEINENTAVRAASIYAKTSEDGISAAFEQIMKSVSTPSVTLDGNAVLREVLTDYFDLADGADLDEFVDKNDIKTYVAAYAGMVNGAHTFGTPIEVTDLDVELVASVVGGRVDTVEVSGFDYSANYVRQDEETGAYLGYKLIVKVPIKARDGFWGGNNVPTNKDTTAIYDDGKLIEEFPIPEVNVPIGVELSTVDRTIYYGNETNANVLFNELKVHGCGETDTIVKIENGQPVLTDVPEWMREFVEIELSQPDGIDPTASGSYTYAVQLAPTKSGTTNQSDPPSNMAGTPVGAVEAESTGNIYILVPQYVFKDSVVKIGAANDMDNNLASDVAWVKMNADQPDAPTIGVAPDLTLTFSVAHNAAIYDHTAVDVNVSGGNSGVDYEAVTVFKWGDCKNDYHEDGLGTIVEHLAAADDSKEFWIHIGQIPGHTVVIDFGHSVDVHVLNDEQIVSPALYSVDGSGCRFGTAEMMDGGIVRYTVNTMAMDSHDTIYYKVYSTTEGTAEDNVHTYTSTVTVIPATTIYYEDNFGSITYDAYAYAYRHGAWEVSDYDRAWVDATLPTTAEEEATDSTEPPVVQDEDRPGSLGEAIDKDNLYGYDSNYTEMQSYSMNSAKMFTATEESDGTIVYGTATFDFIGTGFDVISLTSGRTGTITVEIFKLDENGNYAEYEYGLPKDCRVGVVDTYYSYKYEDSDGDGVKEWSKLQNPDDANGAVNNTLYQVPVIKMTGLEHGKYEAIITVSYNDFFNHNQYGGEKKYDFYLDAIRIYDPANDGEGNEDIQNAYIADGEGWPEYFELRNLLINKNSFDSLGEDDNIGGIVFIDGNAALSDANGGNTGSTVEEEEDPLYGKHAEIADYANFGPNNELYLAPGQAVAFALDVITTDKDVLASVQLALKSVGGTANVKVYAADVENAHNILTGDQNFKTISTATDLYYNITSLNGHTVVIFNDADSPAILSVTNVKVTYKQAHEDGIQKNNFVTTQTVGTFALRSVRHLLASRGMTTGHSGSIVYTNNGDTHSAIYNCCGEAYVTDETHDYDQNTHACVCGAVDTRKNGIIAEDGSLYYYVGGQRTYAGLIELDGDYYYVRTSGEVVHGRNYWTTKTNGLLPAASYYFNESGKLCDKNGFVKEDGGIYYYVDGERSYAGLIYVDGNHYYVRSSGEVVTGRSYWTTKTNGLLPAASYYFDEDGEMQPPIDTVKNGIYQEGDKLYYYANGERTYAGLVQYSGKLTMEDGTVVDGIYSNAYIYVRSSGEVVAGRSYWITKTNDLLNAAYYQFDENGVMVNPPA